MCPNDGPDHLKSETAVQYPKVQVVGTMTSPVIPDRRIKGQFEMKRDLHYLTVTTASGGNSQLMRIRLFIFAAFSAVSPNPRRL